MDNNKNKRSVSFKLEDVFISDVNKLSEVQGIRASTFYRNAVKTYIEQQKVLLMYSEMTKALSNIAMLTDLNDPEQLKVLDDFKRIAAFITSDKEEK